MMVTMIMIIMLLLLLMIMIMLITIMMIIINKEYVDDASDKCDDENIDYFLNKKI
jgi:hypothetical protein